jgi:hypothetical protein
VAAGAASDGFADVAADAAGFADADPLGRAEVEALALAEGVTTVGAVATGTWTGGFAVGVVSSSPALMPIKVRTVASTAIATTAPTTQAVLLG